VTLDAANHSSTTEWVDEAYSKQLWGRLLRRADSIPPTSLHSFWSVRKHGLYVWQDSSKGRERGVMIFVPAANRALELVFIKYDRNGQQVIRSGRLMGISQHAGQRLYERLRTNSVEDVFDTLCGAVLAFIQHNAINPIEFQGVEKRVLLPHGILHVVADAGLWVAKTFIPTKPE
jgi:hypothetical protein